MIKKNIFDKIMIIQITAINDSVKNPYQMGQLDHAWLTQWRYGFNCKYSAKLPKIARVRLKIDNKSQNKYRSLEE